MALPAEKIEVKDYVCLPTMRRFHQSPAQFRCIVGPVGSGKTSAATMEVCYYLPHFLYEQYGYKKTRWAVIRNTYRELADTTQKTVFEWFPNGRHLKGEKNYYISFEDGIEVEVLFRSCDNPNDLKKFQSLEITGYWIDESIQVHEDIKRMLKNRIGRFPQKCPTRFGIETTNPPDVEHPTYSMFKWHTPPPGPIPSGDPLAKHTGFWQPPRENEANLRPNYYNDLINDYKDNKDWADMYVEGKPGITVRGKLVYANFERAYHVARGPLVWNKGTLYRGWDNSGNCPACVVLQVPTTGQLQVLREFHTDRLNIVNFTQDVVGECNRLYPNAEYVDWADPAGNNEYSTREGTFTSNAKLMDEACGVKVQPSEQNLTARINSVDDLLLKRDGLLLDPSCIRLINGFLGGYCYAEIGTTGRFTDTPQKNRFSHPHDGLQYLVVKLTKHSSGGSDLEGWTPTR